MVSPIDDRIAFVAAPRATKRFGFGTRFKMYRQLRREAKAWNRRMNRDHIKINWKFDRKAALRKFDYKRNLVPD